MIGVARHAPLFTKVVDRLAPISHEFASALKAAGYDAVGRYLENLAPYERDGLFSAGLGILPLSEAPGPSAPFSDALGRSRAMGLLQKTDLLGIPPGVHLMIDLEGQHGSLTDLTAYDVAISSELARPGYIPLAYVGAGQLLNSEELFALPDVHLYWRGGSRGIPEPSCGFAMWQIPPLEATVSLQIVDVSVTGADFRGRQPIFWYGS
jgi:hypothetical protein